MPMSTSSDVEPSLERAQDLIVEAIRLLDEAGAPSDIAAHLDLALHRLSASGIVR